MWTTASFCDFPHDASCDVVAGEQLRRSARVSVALRVSPAFLRVIGGLVFVKFGDVVKHKASSFTVCEDAAFAAHTFSNQNATHAWGPDHPGRMELNKLHVNEFRACVVSEGVSIAGVFPTVASNFESLPYAAGCENDCLR